MFQISHYFQYKKTELRARLAKWLKVRCIDQTYSLSVYSGLFVNKGSNREIFSHFNPVRANIRVTMPNFEQKAIRAGTGGGGRG